MLSANRETNYHSAEEIQGEKGWTNEARVIAGLVRGKNFFMASSAKDIQGLRVCAKALRADREAIESTLFGESGRDSENRFQDSAEQLRQRVRDNLDLLIKHLEGREDFGILYAGQRNYELTNLQKTRADNLEACRLSVQRDGDIYRSYLARHVTQGELEAFESEYRHLTRGLVNDATRHVRTLFIGDCIMSEILSFVVGPIADEGISIEPFPINPRDMGQLDRILSGLATKQFDVIFFSPFSHNRLAEVKALIKSGARFSSRANIQKLIDSIIGQTRWLLDELSRRFECPIFVHNAGFVARATSAPKAAVRLLLSYRSRHMAADRINQWLADYVAAANTMTFQRFFVIDETELVRKFGRCALGQFLSTSQYLHSVVLSQRLAREYRIRIAAVGHLMDKKLVLCNPDNALWEVIHDAGPVVHYKDRQLSLKRLKDHSGVVLALASENGPQDLHFEGGVLASADFVSPQMNWNQESNSIDNINNTLNLQTKHIVLLDDRPDQRARARESFPDVLTLDPRDPATWELIDLWGAMTFGSDVDRTRMYQEKALRDAITKNHTDDGSGSETLKELGLVISLSNSKRSDLKRAAELINRTNQWNLCGTRTTFEQVREWHESTETTILLAHVADRFGDMGTVGIAVVAPYEDRVEIPVFVLSCRAFGYGVESAMLAEIVRRCEVAHFGKPVLGYFRSTTQNHPCRNMYVDHGFTLHDGAFRWNGSPLPGVPWAKIRLSV
jgi:FkbH-like protein